MYWKSSAGRKGVPQQVPAVPRTPLPASAPTQMVRTMFTCLSATSFERPLPKANHCLSPSPPASGVVYFLTNSGDCHERFQAEGPLHSLLQDSDQETMAVITHDMVVTQLSVTVDGKLSPTTSVSLSKLCNVGRAQNQSVRPHLRLITGTVCYCNFHKMETLSGFNGLLLWKYRTYISELS